MKNKLLYFLVSLLGFATACDKEKQDESVAMYGIKRPSTHRILGKVTDTAGNPIKGIQVRTLNPDWYITTEEKGTYILSHDFTSETTRLIFADIDGPENGGEFLEKRIDVTFTEADRKDGLYVKPEVNIQLTKKE